MKVKMRWIQGLVILSLLAVASSGFTAGFALIEQSVKGLGNGFAGGSAAAEDASTVYFNPAGMTLLPGQQVVAGAHVIMPSAKFTKTTAQNVLTQPLSGGDGGEAGQSGIAPNLYYTLNPGHGWVFGLGVNAPFGLATEYDSDWVGRYHAVKSEVKTININPAVAYRVNDRLSLGAGVSAQYIDATLSSMVDFGLKAYTLTGNTALVTNGVVSNHNADIYSEITADDWSYGYNLGLLYEFSKDTRVGLAYRSKVKHKLTGDAKFSMVNAAYLQAVGLLTTAQGTFVNQGASGNIDLPASASLSVYHRYDPSLAVMADVTWTQWSSFDKLVIDFDGTLAGTPSVTTENWDDTWRFAVGATYNPSPELALRMGLAYDQTVIPSDEYRTPRIPDQDRYWVTVGGGYQLTPSWSFDLAYAHLFVSDAKLNKVDTGSGENAGRGTVVGTYENSVDIASAQISYMF